MSMFEVIRGVEGCCLALDDTRIAGPKPWGGGTVIHAWETDKEYKAVDTRSRWHQLFGTPERAARTLAKACGECSEAYPCRECPLYPIVGSNVYEPEILEWLRGESDD